MHVLPTDRCPRKRLEAALRRQRGLTLLEILIVLALVTVVMAVVATQVFDIWGEADEKVAAIQVRKYSHEAYARWRLNNQGQGCPSSLEELAKLIDQDTKDPWGTELQMLCGSDAPPEAQPFGVVSAGPDKNFGTDDDIKSWQLRKQQ